MKIYRRQENLTFSKPLALTIGNFDGVHLGHQQILAQLQKRAAQDDCHSALLSFFPHPKTLIHGRAPPLLSTLRDRSFWLNQAGLDIWLLQSFTRAFRTLSPEDFVAQYLAPLHVRSLLVGDDFRFGYRGRGDFALLAKLAPRYGFSVAALPTVARDGKRISSSAIRTALAHHDLKQAHALLGHGLTFTGQVRHGAGRGKHLSAPTANLHLPANWCLPDGVYVVKIAVFSSGQHFYGVANVGITPTFGGTRRKLEAHLFGAAGNLYQSFLQVEIIHYLRAVKTFPDKTALLKQIQQDIANAQAFINQEN